MIERLPDRYFDDMYAASPDPWRLAERWYERRKYAITLAMLPEASYRHAFEAGCSVGVLTDLLADRCDRVTAIDVSDAALEATRERLQLRGRADRVTLHRRSLDAAWPDVDVDLVVLSEVLYYLAAPVLRTMLDRECVRLRPGATLVAAHWRHRVADYPSGGDEVHDALARTDGLHRLAAYADDDVLIDVFVVGRQESVASRTGVPGAFRNAARMGSPAAVEREARR